ncbi:MAG: hypothetical protein GYA77_04965 [Candidatus Cloacimonetes bacterium]|jgi:heparosan-N-sulfate-glucuronate 5-epimerase|nr:hypothetical protein [Candidatus Cloacimonadota bacterium]
MLSDPRLWTVVAHALIWQVAEPKMQAWGERAVTLLTGRPLNQTRRFDERGIPIQLYRDLGLQYNPLFVAAQANRDYQRRKDPARRASFLKLTDWLLEHSEVEEGRLWLPYRFDLPRLGLRAPWCSALAQARSMLAFARRYELTAQDDWLQNSVMAMRTLAPGSSLTRRLPDGSLWFQEYPGEGQPFVLNGMLAILLCLWDTYKITGQEEAHRLFEAGYAGLLARLGEFDYRGFSYYDLNGGIASRNYHQKHISYLRKLNRIKPHPELKKYTVRWQAHDLLPVGLQLFYNPRPKRIAAFLLSLAGCVGIGWLLTLLFPRGT